MITQNEFIHLEIIHWLPKGTDLFRKYRIIYSTTRELPGVAQVHIFTGKGNTHLKWNIEVAHVEEKIFE